MLSEHQEVFPGSPWPPAQQTSSLLLSAVQSGTRGHSVRELQARAGQGPGASTPGTSSFTLNSLIHLANADELTEKLIQTR